jgi:hypothetical protein
VGEPNLRVLVLKPEQEVLLSVEDLQIPGNPYNLHGENSFSSLYINSSSTHAKGDLNKNFNNSKCFWKHKRGYIMITKTKKGVRYETNLCKSL